MAFAIIGSLASGLVAPSSHKLHAVLFDIDGTLFNSDALHLAVFQDILAEEGYNDGRRIDESFFLEHIVRALPNLHDGLPTCRVLTGSMHVSQSGKQNKLICEDLFPDWSEDEGAAFAQRKEQRFRDLAASKLPLLLTPGLHTFCNRLRAAGVACAAVTNAPRANAELMIAAVGPIAGKPSLEFFSPLIIGDECSQAKPHPEPYLAAMRELGVRAENCLAFEDSPSGAAAAVAAGVMTIGITSTQTADVLEHQAGCSLTIANFEDASLEKLLCEVWAVPSAEDSGFSKSSGAMRTPDPYAQSSKLFTRSKDSRPEEEGGTEGTRW